MAVNVNSTNWMRISVTKPIRDVHFADTLLPQYPDHIAYGRLVIVLTTVADFFLYREYHVIG